MPLIASPIPSANSPKNSGPRKITRSPRIALSHKRPHQQDPKNPSETGDKIANLARIHYQKPWKT